MLNGGRWRAGARTAIVAVVLATLLGWVASPAQADSRLDCPSPHQCVVVVSSPASGGGGGNGGVAGGGGGGESCDNLLHACYVVGLGWWSPATRCWYMNIGGDEYIKYCHVGKVQHDPVVGPPTYVILPNPPDGYGGPPDPLLAAAKAVNQLEIGGPVIVLAPASGGAGGLVGLPVWMSTRVIGTADGRAATWGAASATASIPGLSATATATAQAITWDMGDGNTVVCDNPGSEYGGAAGGSPDCGYTYRAPSYDRPGGRYTVTATTTWMVVWSATDGAHGWVTVQAASATTVRINDLEVVVR